VASPADREAEARADVERITKALFEEFEAVGGNPGCRFEDCGERVKSQWRTTVRMLVIRDVIRVGKRPSATAQMAGQTSLDD
jgi:hypothetical protein